MFKPDYELAIRYDQITDVHSADENESDPKTLIGENGQFFAGNWRVIPPGIGRVVFRVRFEDEDRIVFHKGIRPFIGTMLLGTDHGKLAVKTLKDNVLDFLENTFQVNVHVKEEPSSEYRSTWKSPSAFDDWKVSVIATDGKCDTNIAEDDLFGYGGDLVTTVTDATWVVLCEESRAGVHTERKMTLTTERDPFELEAELQAWLNDNDLCGFADLFETYRC